MKILHTSDLHLREDRPETVEALEALLSKAEEEGVDLLTIAGDVFHNPESADALRPRLRTLLSGHSFELLAIPGNHDVDVYRKGLEFGENLDILVDEPFEKRNYGDVTVVGVPYRDRLDEELFHELSEEGGSGGTTCLLLHCTLDIGFCTGDVGDEEEVGYFPVSKSTLSKLGFDFTLAGHIHSTDRSIPLGNGGKFVYPGSPVSLTTKELGRRHAVLIDTEKGTHSALPLETFYYDKFTETLRPGQEDAVIEWVREWCRERDGDDCELTVSVDGFIEMEEAEFDGALKESAGSSEVVNETKDVTDILEHPLYTQFSERLREKEDVENAEGVEQRVMNVFSELLARRGGIRP